MTGQLWTSLMQAKKAWAVHVSCDMYFAWTFWPKLGWSKILHVLPYAELHKWTVIGTSTHLSYPQSVANSLVPEATGPCFLRQYRSPLPYPFCHFQSKVTICRSALLWISYSVRLGCNFIFHTFHASYLIKAAAASQMGRFQNESVAEQIYRAFTRKNSVYVSVIMIGAVIGEKVCDFPCCDRIGNRKWIFDFAESLVPWLSFTVPSLLQFYVSRKERNYILEVALSCCQTISNPNSSISMLKNSFRKLRNLPPHFSRASPKICSPAISHSPLATIAHFHL